MKKRDKNITELLPIAFYDEQKEVFYYQDGTIMNIFQIQAKDIGNLDEEEQNLDNLKFEKFYKTNEFSIKIWAMNFPENTEEQQEFYRKKIEKCKNPKIRADLETSLEELRFIQENYHRREFMLQVFAKKEEEYKKIVNNIQGILGLDKRALCIEVSRDKKEQVLFKIANKNL